MAIYSRVGQVPKPTSVCKEATSAASLTGNINIFLLLKLSRASCGRLCFFLNSNSKKQYTAEHQLVLRHSRLWTLLPSILASSSWTLCLRAQYTKFTNYQLMHTTIHASTNINWPYSMKCDVTTLIPSVTAPAYVKNGIILSSSHTSMQYTVKYSIAITMERTYFFFSSFQNSNFISSSAM